MADVDAHERRVDVRHLIAEYSLLLGVRLKDTPPGIGTRQEILAKYRLTPRS